MKNLPEGAHLLNRPRKSKKSVFFMFSSQEIGSSLVALEMIFEFLQSEIFKNPRV